jgi:hypothetical protein
MLMCGRRFVGLTATIAAIAVVAVCGGGFVAASAAEALPDQRGYELVSPPDKNGADVLLTTERTRVATDGNAFGFAALGGFVDTHGLAVAADYVSVRSRSANPGTNGWSTHGVTPVQRALALGETVSAQEPLYVGPYSSDLNTGVFFAISPLTDAPAVSQVPNLFRRTDLLTPGAGTFQLITACPLCEMTSTPLPPLSGDPVSRVRGRPTFSGASSDFEHVAFESPRNLTPDAPAQPAGCDPTRFPFSWVCGMRLYEWDNGTVRLAGILPDGRPADASFAGQGTHHGFQTPGVISDGSDGHTRVFFTQPTDDSGATISQAGSIFGAVLINFSAGGNLFMRVDHTSTEQLNLPEDASDAFAPARFADSSADGTRAFFVTGEALTSDAPADTVPKLYMYDATRPGADPHNLTLLSRDTESADGTGAVLGTIGASRDGRSFYFVAQGQLVSGRPLVDTAIYRWHDGQLTFVAPVAPGNDELFDLIETGVTWTLNPQRARVSADGRALLFGDYTACDPAIGTTCRELYVYSAATNTVACASCDPGGALPTGSADDFLGTNTSGGTRADPTKTNAVSADGSRVFFSSPDALVPQDTNGRYDAYEYDVATGVVALLTSGRSTADSYFINASPSGGDAFVITRERLVGWDTDAAYDLYDARVNGGFPEPPPAPPVCSGDDCQGLPQPPPGAYVPHGSAGFSGGGNERARLRSHHRKRACRRGRVLRRVRGRRRCVRRHARHRRHATRTSRRGA